MTTTQTLLTPSEGVPDVCDTPAMLSEAVGKLINGVGPLAVDAERASGYRYSQRAYLVQVRRRGSGTFLIDPTAFDDLSSVQSALKDIEWIFHAASQDIPCLREITFLPEQLFDTELAGRLCGFQRVALGTLTERLLGLTLKKSHSAVDWSTRPLKREWLEYAALDVELLEDLARALTAELRSQHKLEWAVEEFDALLNMPSKAPRRDPWRRTSGIHKVRTQDGLARVRAMWEARDAIAQERDTAPGRIFPDSAIVAAALSDPRTERKMTAIPGALRAKPRVSPQIWLDALAYTRTLRPSELPPTTMPLTGPPPASRWGDKAPEAAERLRRARACIAKIAEERAVPVENLLTPEILRTLIWEPPELFTPEEISAELHRLGARPWQISLVAADLAEAVPD